MKNFKKIVALVLCLAMCFCFLVGCGGGTSGSDKTLVAGYNTFNSKFSPFFSETAYDTDVYKMTQVALLPSDRQGAVLLNSKDGEVVPYNGKDYTYTGISNCKIEEKKDGKVVYDFTLRDDVKFSDGEPLTVDDAIFSMYVLSDPTYTGSVTFFTVPIEGMDEYRSGMESRRDLILKTENKGYEKNDFFTEEQYNTFWKAFDEAGANFAQSIADFCIAQGYNAEGDSLAKCAANWGYELKDDATAADFFAKILKNYGYNIEGIDAEKADNGFLAFLSEALGDADDEISAGVQTGKSVDYIKGIEKTGDNTFRITLTKVDAAAIYQLAAIVAPLHYYGDKAKYDYENHKFGFDKGDLSTVRSKTTKPLGAGPYKFVKFENGTVRFEANENYYLGEPKIKYLNFLETQEADKLNGVTTGTVDVTDPAFNGEAIKAIQKANGGELNGDKIAVNTVDNLGYGYIGMNSKNVCVGKDRGSKQSKSLRKAFATIFSAYRDVAIDSYYGEAADIINYPISNTSWAAPQPTDDGYEVAFSKDKDGKDIYTSEMKAEDKYAAAKKAALGFFEEAGYKVSNGKVTKAPEGAKMEYEFLIPADGNGDHPSFLIATESSKALKELGINLIVTDLANGSELWTKLEAGQVDMWAAAWQATPDPDMYQIYFSGMDGKDRGGSNYHYEIDDTKLNKLILDARASFDTDYRKSVYKACLDIIVDWAVEIPVYQRQNAIIFNPQTVNMETVTPDITTFYNWYDEIQNMEMN